MNGQTLSQDVGMEPRGLADHGEKLARESEFMKSPIFEAAQRLAKMVEVNGQQTRSLRRRLNPVMDMSPRPENPNAQSKGATTPASAQSVVQIIHTMADLLSETNQDIADTLDRLQV